MSVPDKKVPLNLQIAECFKEIKGKTQAQCDPFTLQRYNNLLNQLPQGVVQHKAVNGKLVIEYPSVPVEKRPSIMPKAKELEQNWRKIQEMDLQELGQHKRMLLLKQANEEKARAERSERPQEKELQRSKIQKPERVTGAEKKRQQTIKRYEPFGFHWYGPKSRCIYSGQAVEEVDHAPSVSYINEKPQYAGGRLLVASARAINRTLGSYGAQCLTMRGAKAHYHMSRSKDASKRRTATLIAARQGDSLACPHVCCKGRTAAQRWQECLNDPLTKKKLRPTAKQRRKK